MSLKCTLTTFKILLTQSIKRILKLQLNKRAVKMVLTIDRCL